MPSPSTIPDVDNFAELLERLGDVPLHRILVHPAPGTATEQHALELLEADNKRIVELIDGVLVEKVMGTREALLGGILYGHLRDFVRRHKLGKVLPADGILRLMPGLVRIPDVSFLSWTSLREGIPGKGIGNLVPDLAVEVVSEGNTRGEMQRKLRDYFLSGVQLVWLVYPKTETAFVYRAPDRRKRVARTGRLDGEDVLPGFSLSLQEVFAEADESEPVS